MKKIIKNIAKSLTIYLVISMTILSNVCYGYSSREVGEAVAGYALHLLEWGNKEENYCDGLGGYGPALRYNQCGGGGKDRSSHPTLTNPNPSTPWFYDCSSFTAAMYNMTCNKEVFGWSYTTWSFRGSSALDNLGPVGDGSSCLPGDIICSDGHVEIFISQELGTGGAHTNHPGSNPVPKGGVDGYSKYAGQVDCKGLYTTKSISPASGNIYRLKESVASTITDLNTEFSAGGSSNSQSAIDYSNFFFTGIPDGKYSLASRKSIFEIVVDALSSLLDFFTGLLTYLFRGVIISFISVFDRLMNNTMGAINGDDKSLKESGVSATDADDPIKMHRTVTMEGIIFGDEDMDLFDINIFRVD